MFKFDGLNKRFALFGVVYLLLIILFQWKPLQQAHNEYYCKIGKGFFNLVNANYVSTWRADAPENQKDWNTTIKLFSKERHGSRLDNVAYLRSTQPDRMIYNNFYSYALLPLLFLISLYIATPGFKWNQKLWRFFVSLFILYIFLAFFTSNVIENVILTEGKIGDTTWQKFISVVGFYGLTESIYIIAALSWAVLVFRKEMIGVTK